MTTEIIPLRSKIQQSALKLFHRLKHHSWFENTEVNGDELVIVYKKGKFSNITWHPGCIFEEYKVKLKESKKQENLFETFLGQKKPLP